MLALNSAISADESLRRQYCLGHSFLLPSDRDDAEPDAAWYQSVVASAIAPLLDEYWCDRRAEAADRKRRLLDGIT